MLDAQKQKYYEDAAVGLNQPRGDEDDLEYEDEDEGKEFLDSSLKKTEKQFKETGDDLVGLEEELDDIILGPQYREEILDSSDEGTPEYYEDDLDKDLGGGKRRRRTRKNKRCKKRKTKRKRHSTKKKHQKKRKGTRKK